MLKPIEVRAGLCAQATNKITTQSGLYSVHFNLLVVESAKPLNFAILLGGNQIQIGFDLNFQWSLFSSNNNKSKVICDHRNRDSRILGIFVKSGIIIWQYGVQTSRRPVNHADLFSKKLYTFVYLPL